MLAVGHGELAYFGDFSLAFFLHTLYYMDLFKILLHILSIIECNKKGTSPGYLLGCSLSI